MRLSSRLMVRKWLRIKMRCNGFLHFHFSVFHFVIEQWVEKDNQIDPVVGVFFRDCFHCSCGWRKLVISRRIYEEKKLQKKSRSIKLKILILNFLRNVKVIVISLLKVRKIPLTFEWTRSGVTSEHNLCIYEKGHDLLKESAYRNFSLKHKTKLQVLKW